MSLKTPRNIVVIGATAILLLAATLLVGGYVAASPGEPDAGSQLKTCQAAVQSSGCCPPKCCPDKCCCCCCPPKCCDDEACCPTEKAKTCCAREATKCCD
jgi:hypothetical protein